MSARSAGQAALDSAVLTAVLTDGWNRAVDLVELFCQFVILLPDSRQFVSVLSRAGRIRAMGES